MKSITWHKQGVTYTATILSYKAIIAEQAGQYTARIEGDDKTVLRNWHGNPIEFEKAERWALFSVEDLEQLGDEDSAKKGMLETLDLCISMLQASIHSSHLQRLANIRQWVISRTTHEREMVQVLGSASEFSLDWSDQTPHGYYAETPHGTAVLVEERPVRSPYHINPTSTYKARIDDSSGAVYESLETYRDFVDAENWLQKTLAELDDPRIAECYLGNIHFTLDICKHGLPPDIDPVHPTRLEYLEMCIDEALL